MMTIQEYLAEYPCEVCGKPSVFACQDTREKSFHEMDDPYGPWREIKKEGNPHFFCEEHKRDSIEYPSVVRAFNNLAEAADDHWDDIDPDELVRENREGCDV